MSNTVCHVQLLTQDIKLTKELTQCLEKHDVFDTDSGMKQRYVLPGNEEYVFKYIYQVFSIGKTK